LGDVERRPAEVNREGTRMKRGERSAARDRALGMNRLIDRRDFLNGAAVALGTALAGPAFGATPPQDLPGYYPPGLGRIVIANSDSGAGAYTDVAIDQAWRAVNDALAIAG
jgi:hypothetical protein